MRGHQLDIVNTLHVHMNITSSRPKLWYGGKVIGHYDAVIPRIGASITPYGLAVLRQFEISGVLSLNESEAIGRSRDKLRALQLLARRGIGLPATAFAHGPRTAEAVIKAVGGAPVIVKLVEGTQGMGVMLAETTISAISMIEAFSAANANILVQEYIREAQGSDVRVMVVGGSAVAAITRVGHGQEFRANLHRGGKAQPTQLSEAEQAAAIGAADALGLNACGVDLLRSQRGPLVIEVNSTPGLRGIETATGTDVAAEIIAFLEAHAQRGTAATRDNGHRAIL